MLPAAASARITLQDIDVVDPLVRDGRTLCTVDRHRVIVGAFIAAVRKPQHDGERLRHPVRRGGEHLQWNRLFRSAGERDPGGVPRRVLSFRPRPAQHRTNDVAAMVDQSQPDTGCRIGDRAGSSERVSLRIDHPTCVAATRCRHDKLELVPTTVWPIAPMKAVTARLPALVGHRSGQG